MADANNILQLKFEGNGIKPNAVKPSEIGTLIQEFEKALLGVVKIENPAIDTNSVLFTFESIEDKSIGLLFNSDNPIIPKEIQNLIVASYISLGASVANNDFSSLDNDTISAIRSIAKFSKTHDCNGHFIHNGKTLGSVTPKSDIKLNKPQYLKGDTTIFGELVDAGGDNPNIHIKINDSYSVIIETDKPKTKELASRLYDYVGLKGFAKWDVITSKIIEFKLYEVLDYAPGNITDTFDELKNLSSGYWDNFNTDEEINKKLLRE